MVDEVAQAKFFTRLERNREIEEVDDLTDLSEDEVTEYDPLLRANPEDFDLDDPNMYPLKPGCDSLDKEFNERWVDYSPRGPRDVILSGPVLAGWGPGRYFSNRRAAYMWALTKYGKERVSRVRYTRGRWAFLIKNLRAV